MYVIWKLSAESTKVEEKMCVLCSSGIWQGKPYRMKLDQNLSEFRIKRTPNKLCLDAS